MRSRILLLTLGVMVLGCYRMTYETAMTRPVLMTGEPGVKYKLIRHFEKTVRPIWILWGLLPIRGVNLGEVLKEELREGDAIINLTVESKQGPVDIGIGCLSSLILPVGIDTRTVTIKGDVVKFITQ